MPGVSGGAAPTPAGLGSERTAQGRHTPCAAGFPLPVVVSIEFRRRGSCCSLELWLAAVRSDPDEHLPTGSVLAGFRALVRATRAVATRHRGISANAVSQAQAQGKEADVQAAGPGIAHAPPPPSGSSMAPNRSWASSHSGARGLVPVGTGVQAVQPYIK